MTTSIQNIPLKTIKGADASLGDYAGKVLLIGWSSSASPPMTLQARSRAAMTRLLNSAPPISASISRCSTRLSPPDRTFTRYIGS